MENDTEMYSIEYFRENLKELLSHKKIKQYQFAEMLDIAPPNVNSWLAGGREPSMYSFLRICNALNVSPDWLLRKNKFVDFEE